MKIYVKDEQTVVKATRDIKNIEAHIEREGQRVSGKFKALFCLKVKLKIKDSSKQYGRRSPWMASKKYGRKRIAAVCYHGHYDFMAAIFEIEPDAVIKSSMATYNGKAEFEEKAPDLYYKDIGSMMRPAYYGEACECERGA